MRVLIVMPSASPRGGAEEALVQLCENADAVSLKLRVVFLESGELVDRVRMLISECAVIDAGRLRNPLRFIRAVANLSRVLKQWKADVVVGWMTKAHIYGSLAAMLAGLPAVCFQMGVPDRGIVDRLSRVVPAAGILTCSEFAAREQRKVVRWPVIGVPLAADEARFKVSVESDPDRCRRQLDLPVGQPLIGIVGRLQRWKGIHVFLEAMALVHRVHPEVKGVVVGGQHDLEPDYPRLLIQQVEALGLSSVVRMAGVQRNVSEWMQAMDVVVHASDREPFGIVVVEAMALGKPVVATKPGGPEEIIRDQVDGVLVPFGNAKILAEAIVRYLQDPEFASRCAGHAALRARAFTAAAYTKRLSEALRCLISENRPAI